MPGLAGGGNGERFPGLVIFGGLPQIQFTFDGVIPCPIIRLGPCAKVSWLSPLAIFSGGSMVSGMADIISRRLRSLLADHFSDKYFLKNIECEFEDAGVPYRRDETFQGGERRTLVAGYYNGLDFTNAVDARKFLNVCVSVLKEADRQQESVPRSTPPWVKSIPQPELEHPLARLILELRRCGYEWREGAIVSASSSARLADTKAYADRFDLNHLTEHIQRIEKAIDADPPQAIGSAKELVETVAKTILTKRNVPYARGDDILGLGKAVFKTLKQVPDGIPEAAKGAAIIKRTLSNLASLVQGIAELRGFYGTGHGQEGNFKGLRARHAKLAVGAAATLATYWIETDREMP